MKGVDVIVGGKMVIKSKLKWVGLVGLVLSALSLFTHFLLARYSSYTDEGLTEYQAITIFSWRPVFEINAPDLNPTVISLISHFPRSCFLLKFHVFF